MVVHVSGFSAEVCPLTPSQATRFKGVPRAISGDTFSRTGDSFADRFRPVFMGSISLALGVPVYVKAASQPSSGLF